MVPVKGWGRRDSHNCRDCSPRSLHSQQLADCKLTEQRWSEVLDVESARTSAISWPVTGHR